MATLSHSTMQADPGRLEAITQMRGLQGDYTARLACCSGQGQSRLGTWRPAGTILQRPADQPSGTALGWPSRSPLGSGGSPPNHHPCHPAFHREGLATAPSKIKKKT